MIIIDVEASGLAPQSYPIEIAWRHRYNPKLRDSFLILPADEWTYWDDYSEKEIHHISRSELLEKGIFTEVAAKRLNACLADQTVFSDAVEFDRRWIRELFHVCGIEMAFKINSVFSLIHPAKVERYHHHIGRKVITHRADQDVAQIVEVLNYVEP